MNCCRCRAPALPAFWPWLQVDTLAEVGRVWGHRAKADGERESGRQRGTLDGESRSFPAECQRVRVRVRAEGTSRGGGNTGCGDLVCREQCDGEGCVMRRNCNEEGSAMWGAVYCRGEGAAQQARVASNRGQGGFFFVVEESLGLRVGWR